MADYTPEERFSAPNVKAEYEGREIHATIHYADPGPGQCAEWQVDCVLYVIAPNGRCFHADRYLAKCSPKQRRGFMSALDRAI